MPSVLLRLAGPMQSWGTTSRFDERDTAKEPSKSGVIGLVAAALGIDRENWPDLEPLTMLALTVRHDRSGMLKRDYQTAGAAKGESIIKASGSLSKDGVVSQRFYLSDAAFLVALTGENSDLLGRIHDALRDPRWPLFLGRKSYVPSEPVWFTEGIQYGPPADVIRRWPWIATRRPWEGTPSRLLVSAESIDGTGTMRVDQPLSSFGERRFGARLVRSEWIPLPPSASNAAA